jgi:hypothetical protein
MNSRFAAHPQTCYVRTIASRRDLSEIKRHPTSLDAVIPPSDVLFFRFPKTEATPTAFDHSNRRLTHGYRISGGSGPTSAILEESRTILFSPQRRLRTRANI